MIWLLSVTLYSFFNSPPLLTWLSTHQPSCCAFNCSKTFAILFHVLRTLFPQILTQPILLFHSSFCSNVISPKGFSEIFMTPALFYLIAFLITWYHLIFIYVFIVFLQWVWGQALIWPPSNPRHLFVEWWPSERAEGSQLEHGRDCSPSGPISASVGYSRSVKLFNRMEEKTCWLYFSKACLEPKGHFL